MASLAALVIAAEPEGVALLGAVVSIAVLCAAIASLTLLRTAAVGRSVRARTSRVRAVRRGVEVGAAVGLIALLQVVGGLTPLTAIFVALSFAIAEYVLSAGAPTPR